MVKGSGVALRPDSLWVEFDDERLVADAGVVLTSTLVDRLGLERLVDETVDLGRRPGAARPGRKVCSLAHAIALGADSIDDCDLLRAGGTAALLGHRAMAPSTLGTFLRSFTFGHVRQLDRVLAETLARAWSAGAGPDEERLVVDSDSCVGGARPREGGRRFRLHRRTRLSPLARHPLGLGRGPARAAAQGAGRVGAGRVALRAGADRPRAPRRRPR